MTALQYNPVELMPNYWFDEYGTYDVVICSKYPENVSLVGFVNSIINASRVEEPLIMERFTPWDYPWCDSYIEKLYPILQWLTGIRDINKSKSGSGWLEYGNNQRIYQPRDLDVGFVTGNLFEFGRKVQQASDGITYNGNLNPESYFFAGGEIPTKVYDDQVNQGSPLFFNVSGIEVTEPTVITWMQRDSIDPCIYPVYVKRYKILYPGTKYTFTNDFLQSDYNVFYFEPITHSIVVTFLKSGQRSNEIDEELPPHYYYENLDDYVTETFAEILVKYPEIRQFVIGCTRRLRFDFRYKEGYFNESTTVDDNGENPIYRRGHNLSSVSFSGQRIQFSNLVWASLNPNEVNECLISYAPNNFWGNETKDLINKNLGKWRIDRTNFYQMRYENVATSTTANNGRYTKFLFDARSGLEFSRSNLVDQTPTFVEPAELPNGTIQNLPFKNYYPEIPGIASGSTPISYYSFKVFINEVDWSEVYPYAMELEGSDPERWAIFESDLNIIIYKHTTSSNQVITSEFLNLTIQGAVHEDSLASPAVEQDYEFFEDITLNVNANFEPTTNFPWINPNLTNDAIEARNLVFNEVWKLNSNSENIGIMPDSLRIKEIHEALEAHRFTGADLKLKISTDGEVQGIPNTLAAQIEYTQEAIGGFNFPGEFTSGRYASTEPQEPIKFNNLPDFINKIYQELQASLGAGYHEISTGEDTKATYVDISDMMDDLLRMVSVCYSLVSDSRVADARMQYMIFEIIKALGVRANLNTLPVGFEGEVAVVPGFDMASPSVMQAVRDILLNLQLLTKGAEREFYDKEFYENES